MTDAAQAALRRTMEKESRNTRFCLICNYVSRIIQPLTSRCTKFRFKPLSDEMVLERFCFCDLALNSWKPDLSHCRLIYICKEEAIECDDDVLNTLIKACGGDMRRAITSLQSSARLKTSAKISVEDVYEVTGIVPSSWLCRFMNACKEKSINQLVKFVEELTLEGFSALQVGFINYTAFKSFNR